jgi:hypothetical protein
MKSNKWSFFIFDVHLGHNFVFLIPHLLGKIEIQCRNLLTQPNILVSGTPCLWSGTTKSPKNESVDDMAAILDAGFWGIATINTNCAIGGINRNRLMEFYFMYLAEFEFRPHPYISSFIRDYMFAVEEWMKLNKKGPLFQCQKEIFFPKWTPDAVFFQWNSVRTKKNVSKKNVY